MTILITVWGASPGMGKSTLCTGLARRLTDAGLRVDHFREEDIMTRPQFAAVAEEFTATGRVEPATLLAATARFVESVLRSDDDVVIADALVPFVPTLLAMGHDEPAIDAFLADLTPVLAPVGPVMVFLDGDAATALPRAARREGPHWLDWYVAKLARYRVEPAVTDAASAVTYLRRERAATLATVRRSRWQLVVVDQADRLSPAEVLEAAQHGLQPWLPTATRSDGHGANPA